MRKYLLFFTGVFILQLVKTIDMDAKSLEGNNLVAFQGIPINGLVTSLNDNQPLPGVTVIELGTTNGTITDDDGKYTITVSSSNAILRFSFMGFLPEEIDVSGQSTINVALVWNILTLDEIVVVGYGTAKKSDLTSPVASVREEDIQKSGATNLTQALQGKASGVYVSRGSGAPGEAVSIYVRGVGSTNNTNPLYVVDGIALSEGASNPTGFGDNASWKGSGIGTFDVSDIESVEVLKDASSTAIYGARGANGVILITTKRGKKGKPVFNFSASYGTASPMNLPKLVNAKEYSDLIVESYLNSNLLGIKSSPYYKISNTPDTVVQSTDWMKELYHKATLQNYVLNYSAGGEFSNQYASLSYTNEEGTYISTGYKKFSLTFNTDNKVGKWIELGNSFNISFGERNPQEWAQNAIMEVNPFMLVYDTLPNSPYTYGNLPKKYLFNTQNIYGTELIFDRIDKSWNGLGNIYLLVSPIKGLTWKTTVGGTFNYYNSYKHTDPYDLYVAKETVDRLYTNLGEGTTYTANSFLTYNFKLQKHNIALMAGWEIQSISEGNNYSLTASNSSYQEIYNLTDPETRDIGGDKNEPIRWLSEFGRLNYIYNDKYYLTANLRWDGSSKFPPGDQRTGFFPSFSAAWRISKEAFMGDLGDIMNLKIRGGYGSSGNTGPNNFPYLQLYSGGSYYYSYNQNNLLTGIIPNSFPNYDLIWEKVTTTDVGFDLSLYNGKIEVSGDYYLKKTSGMIIAKPIAYHVGLGSDATTDKNAGSLDNKGVELNAAYKSSINKLNYSIGGNISYNKNTLNTDIGPNGALGQFNNISGEPVSSYYGYKVDGLWGINDTSNIINYLIASGMLEEASDYQTSKFTAPGDLKYHDANGDGLDSTDWVNIGDPWPKLVYGLALNASYTAKFGTFDFSAYLTGVYGNKIYNWNKRYYTTMYADFTTTTDALDRWTPYHTNTDIPRMALSDPNGNMSTSSSYFVESGSYLRCKNLVIGYTLPKITSEKMVINNFRIYLNITNLFTLTKYSGMDPEVGGSGSNISDPELGGNSGNISKGLDNGSYPQSKVVLFGAQISF